MIIKKVGLNLPTDLEKTTHYTTHAELVCKNLIELIPKNAILVEPFVGQGDLVALFPDHIWEIYDINSTYPGVIQQDTLLNPPDYSDKWVITNPPFLARNKAQNKILFDRYNLDDLYKIALNTVLNADGGLFIIPTNFFTDERSGEIRRKFLSNFIIDKINIFTIPVFDSTTYSVCAFVFHKAINTKQEISISIYPENKHTIITIAEEYDYRIAGDFYASLDTQENYFGRLTATTTNNITKLKLYALDTRTEKIHITYGEDPYVGKNTDRVYLTFTTDKVLNEDIQKRLCENFNNTLTAFRNKYYDLGMTNYRDYNRKRIGFNFAYKLLSRELDLILQGEN